MKISYLKHFVLFALLTFLCTSNGFAQFDEPDRDIEFEPCFIYTSTGSSYSFSTGSAATGSFMVENDFGWTASTSSSWLTLLNSSGNPLSMTQLSFSATANPSSSSRSTTIFINCNGVIGGRTITVTQPGGVSSITCNFSTNSGQSFRLPDGNSATNSISVTSAASWTATDDASWITLSTTCGAGNGSLSFSVTANNTGVQRIGTITLTCANGDTFDITIIQPPLEIPCNFSTNTGQSFRLPDGNSATNSISVTSAASWTATDNASWITLNTTSGTGNGSLSFSVTTNNTGAQRIGTITLTCANGETFQITIIQQVCIQIVECNLSVPYTFLYFDTYTETALVPVTSNGSWTASDNRSWLYTSRSGNTLIVTCAPALSTYSSTRTGQVTLTCTATGSTLTINVTQFIEGFDGGPDAPYLPRVGEKGKEGKGLTANSGSKEKSAATSEAIPQANSRTASLPAQESIREVATSVSPNPFANHTTLNFGLEKSANVSLEVRDMTGRMVKQLLNGALLPAGTYQEQFSAENLEPGMYIYILRAGDTIQTGKMILKR